MKKRVLAFLMCLCLCLSLFPMAAMAADTYTVTPQFIYPDGVTSGGAIRVLNADGSTTDYTDGEVVTMTAGETCRFIVLPLADGTAGEIGSMSGSRPGSETVDGVTYTTVTGNTSMEISYSSEGPGSEGPGSEGPGGESGEDTPKGPQPAQEDFDVVVRTTLPEGYTGDGKVVTRATRNNDGSVVDFGDNKTYGDGDTISVKTGEWALFGAASIDGYTVEYQMTNASGCGTMGSDIRYAQINGAADDSAPVELAVIYTSTTGLRLGFRGFANIAPGGVMSTDINGGSHSVSVYVDGVITSDFTVVSSDETVCTVEKDGANIVVTNVGSGCSVLTVTAGGYTETFNWNVYEESGEGPGSGDSGGASGEPTDPYTITMDITYPEGYVGEDAGGIQIVNAVGEGSAVVGDGTVSETYEESKLFTVVEVPGLYVETASVVCNCGEKCDHVSSSARPDGVVEYMVRTDVTVSIVYGEISFEDFKVWLDQPSEEDVGLYSALLTARYTMPSLQDHNLFICYSQVDNGEDPLRYMDQYSNYTGSISIRQDADGNYYRPEEFNCLLPNTEYYARAVFQLQDFTIISDPIKFTTDAGECPAVTVAPVDGAYSEDTELIPCTVNGTEQDITFSYMDGLNGADGVSNVAISRLNVTEDGTYRITLNYEEPAVLPDGYAYVFSRLYTMAADGDLWALDNASVSETIAGYFVGDPPGPGDGTSEWDHTYADISLSKDETYYLALDLGAGTGTVSVALLNDNKPVEFSITADPAHYGTGDSRPHHISAVINYSVSGHYNNGYHLEVYYGRKSAYEDTGEFEWKAERHDAVAYQACDTTEQTQLKRCVDGVEYVYYARLLDHITGSVLAESEVVTFTADMNYIRSLKLGENRNTEENRVVDADGHMSECFAFGSDAVVNLFVPEKTGQYLFNANNSAAKIEIYDASGALFATGTAGQRWVSVASELTGGEKYYVYVEKVHSVTPIVTVSCLQSEIAVDNAVLAVEDSGAEIARDALETTINSLTKDDEGAAVELPDYVETDETGETALREAIETGEALTAKVTGTELAESDVEAATAGAMEEEAQAAADAEKAEALLYLDLSVLLTQADEALAKITETAEEITFRIPVSEELAQTIADREVYVIRYHNGEAETLKAELTPEGEYICFSSNCFSTYGLYAPVEEEEVPKTVDLIALMKHIVGVKELENPSDYDYNGDGAINILDVIRAVRYLAGEKVTLN